MIANLDTPITGEDKDFKLPLLTFYVTIGQKYRHEKHPLDGAHPDGVIEVRAVNMEAARTIVEDKLGKEWSGLYEEDKINLNLYPLGIVASI